MTSREREILEFVARGSKNTKIASELKISEKTVRNHVSLIFGKSHQSRRDGCTGRRFRSAPLLQP
ncbi:MAG: LuxR C-terminal-related transcriptional regulator [Xanthobacteraceae bacterium]